MSTSFWRRWRLEWLGGGGLFWWLASLGADRMFPDTPEFGGFMLWLAFLFLYVWCFPWLRDTVTNAAVVGAVALGMLALTIIVGLAVRQVIREGVGSAAMLVPTPHPTYTPPPATWTPVPTPTLPPLSSVQRRLLRLLVREQERLAAHKLIVGRDGAIWGANDDVLDVPVDLVPELYGGRRAAPGEFAALVDAVPELYLRRIPEVRLDSPFVVVVTALGAREAGR